MPDGSGDSVTSPANGFETSVGVGDVTGDGGVGDSVATLGGGGPLASTWAAEVGKEAGAGATELLHAKATLASSSQMALATARTADPRVSRVAMAVLDATRELVVPISATGPLSRNGVRDQGPAVQATVACGIDERCRLGSAFGIRNYVPFARTNPSGCSAVVAHLLWEPFVLERCRLGPLKRDLSERKFVGY